MKWYYILGIVVVSLAVGYFIGQAMNNKKSLEEGSVCKKADGTDGKIKDGKCS